MKKTILLIIAANLTFHSVKSQITKGNWMVGGNFNYSNSKSSGSASFNSKNREITIMPTAGYFIFDKGAIGLKSMLTFSKESYNLTDGTEIANSQNILGVGPFLRYYFLPIENRVNAFSEASIFYKETITNGRGNGRALDYYLLGGIAIFLNSSIGIEFTLGYNNTKEINIDSKLKDVRFGIGFQIYLEKEK